MSDDRSFERTARDWLELGPVEAPDRVIQAALLEIDTTHQERDLRVPWRYSPMPTLARALAAAAVIIGLIAGGALIVQRSNEAQVGGPSPSVVASPPAPSATGLGSSDLSSSFVSARYGYTLPVDPAWTTSQATLTWTGPDNTSPVTDDITVPGSEAFFNGASEPLAPGQTLDEWLAIFQPPTTAGDNCFGGPASTWPTREIGGHAWRWQQGCSAAAAITADGGRVYVFTCGGCVSGAGELNALFDRMLGAVDLQPASAPSPAPAPALAGQFQSDEHGFTLAYPSSWTILQRATAAAPTDHMPVPPQPSLDVLGDATARLSVTSLPLAKGQSADAWAKAFCGFTATDWSQPCAGAPGTWEQVPLAQGAAWLAVNGDSAAQFPKPDSRLFLATAVRGGYAWEVRLEGTVERELFLAILASMQVDPAAVVGSPTP